ncbi:Ribonuclease/ribotoxin [Saitoella complicata NRRL Y-17804]|nr:Ribonuclease/ribotoxin [Saitoella complicata NRRL Y-17804]ODQ51504.1 Ribonuclease/ribotoxin [Saitoella complicata NRRL Y-17804]
MFSLQFLLLALVVMNLALNSHGQTILNAPDTDIQCGDSDLTPSALLSAAQSCLSHILSGTTVGRDNYPHAYKDYEGITFPSGCSGHYYEYPVLNDDNDPYATGPPGAIRVIVGGVDIEKGTGAYCGVITHEGARAHNGFVSCQVEDQPDAPEGRRSERLLDLEPKVREREL